MKKMCEDDSGHIVVETIGAFIPFVLLVVSILSLVNIVAVQARLHYALTQAANTLSMYSYALEAVGTANVLTTIDNKANKVTSEADAFKKDINAVLEGLDSMSDIGGTLESGNKAVKRAYGLGEEALGDPKAALQLLMNYGLNELRGLAFDELVRPLVGRYLANGDITGETYLSGAGVVNRHTGTTGLSALEFYNHRAPGLEESVMIDRAGNVRLTVEYEIMYTFGGLPLLFSPTIRITQTVVTKAWLNGSGKGYW